MAKLILPNIPYELTDKQRNGLTTAEARSALAADAIKTIITEHDQCPQEQRALLESWLEKNNTVQANTDDVSWTDIKWHGRRIIQVPGIVSGFQYYLLSTPKHPNWPPDLYPPPLRFVYDKPDVNGSVQALHDRLKLVIRTVIFYRAKVEILKFKGHVCHAMNNLKDGSRGLHWWRYALNFNPAVAKTIKVNLLLEFPGIAAGLANGRFRALEKDTVLNGISKRTTAVYTTSTNAMVNNAYAVFAERNPNRRAARAFMFREEVLAVLLYENMHRNEAQEDTEQNTSSTPRHQAISVFRQHVENITQSNRELYSPRQHEHSLAATLIVGDPNQFRPIVPSYRKKLRCETLAEKEDDVKVFEFDDLVSEQRRYPILARAQALHGVDFTLHENHRVYGSAGEYMSRNMFNGNMVCTHLGDCAASASLSDYRQYHSKHNLWKQIKGWHLWCEKCCQHGHSQERCDETLVCGFCRAPHAGRNCTKVPQDKTTVTDERWTEGATDKCWPPATEAVATGPAALALEESKKRLPSLDSLQRSVLYKAHAAQKGKQPKVIVCSTRNIAESQRRAI
ncbi:hypothetical protein MY4038_002659 [Beauveria bassiana]